MARAPERTMPLYTLEGVPGASVETRPGTTGDHNRPFGGSDALTCETLKRLEGEARNELRPLPGYGHQDPFMGHHGAEDGWPHRVELSDRHRDGTGQRRTSQGV